MRFWTFVCLSLLATACGKTAAKPLAEDAITTTKSKWTVVEVRTALPPGFKVTQNMDVTVNASMFGGSSAIRKSDDLPPPSNSGCLAILMNGRGETSIEQFFAGGGEDSYATPMFLSCLLSRTGDKVELVRATDGKATWTEGYRIAP